MMKLLRNGGVSAFALFFFLFSAGLYAQTEENVSRDRLQSEALQQAEKVLKEKSGKDLAAAASEAAKILSDCVSQTKLTAEDMLFGIMRASQARYAGLMQDWKNCEIFAEAVLKSSKDADAKKAARYWKAMSQFQTENYSRACRTLEEDKDALAQDTAFSLLYVKSLIKAGRSSDAEKTFASLASGQLTDEARLDYGKFLLNNGRYQASREQTEKVKGAEALYLQGLAAFNQRKWDDAVRLMTGSLKEKSALEEKYASYARFYAGYAQYRTGDYSSSYKTLSSFAEQNLLHPLRYNALITASRAAVQSNQQEKAFPLAEQAIYAAATDEEQNEAVLLAAGLYADAGNFDKAISILTPRTGGRSQAAYRCRYELARIQAQKKDYAAADKSYAALASDKLTGAIGEEAAFRRGELQYGLGNYAQAAKFFDDYSKRWNGGAFQDAALYFNGDSLAKSGNTDRAILYFLQVDNLRGESSYKYNAEKNLVELYQKQGDYASALTYANKLLANYGEQAREDGMANRASELESLSRGGNSAQIKKEAEYEKAGKDSTEKGRAIGTELARIYASSAATKAKGIALAENLLSKQTGPQESQYAAENAFLLAQHYRTSGQNKKSAEVYLSAAQFSRAAGKDEDAARALYGAVEAFDAAGLSGDARATSDSLAQLYPESKYLLSARQIVK